MLTGHGVSTRQAATLTGLVRSTATRRRNAATALTPAVCTEPAVEPANKLTDAERRRVVEVLTNPGKPAHRDRILLRPPVHLGDVGVADLAERRRRRDAEPLLPVQKLTHPAHRLQLRHVGLQKDPIHRSTGQRHMIPQ